MNQSINDSWMKNPVLPLKQPFTDNRGEIQALVSFKDPKIGSAVWIKSKKGSVRANHYHKSDWHYCYVVSGRIEYYHRPANSNIPPLKFSIRSGQVFYTPPLVEHAMVFPEDTIFLTLSGGTRTQEDYEEDLVRVKLV